MSNSLATFAATARRQIFDALSLGDAIPVGTYDVEILKLGKAKGAPQLGATRYEPSAVVFEFIYPSASTAATVFQVRVDAPERIVFMPVPAWVVESIWQGEISGCHFFESEATVLLEHFRQELTPDANPKWFLPQAAKRRE